MAVVVDGAHTSWPTSATGCRPTRRAPTPTIQGWFNGPSDGQAVDVQQPGGRLQLQLTDTDLTGTLTLPTGGRRR